VRVASGADQEGVVRTIKAVYDEYGFTWDEATYHADLYDLDGYYADRGDVFYVAELDGGIVGTAALEFFDPIPGPADQLQEMPDALARIGGCDCSLERLYVHPDARRKGIGAMLTQRVIDDARAAGRTRMEIWSDKRFGEAHRLYGRFGAQVAGERICDDPDVSPEWGLSLELR